MLSLINSHAMKRTTTSFLCRFYRQSKILLENSKGNVHFIIVLRAVIHRHSSVSAPLCHYYFVVSVLSLFSPLHSNRSRDFINKMTAIQGAHAQVAAAQSRFMEAVRKGIMELMQQCGYSRDRATSALLRELGRDNLVPPKNDEVSDKGFSSFWRDTNSDVSGAWES